MKWQVPRARSRLNSFHELHYLPIALTQTYHLSPSASPLSSQSSFIEKEAKRTSIGPTHWFLDGELILGLGNSRFSRLVDPVDVMLDVSTAW